MSNSHSRTVYGYVENQRKNIASFSMGEKKELTLREYLNQQNESSALPFYLPLYGYEHDTNKIPSNESLCKLGHLMTSGTYTHRLDSNIPAGYTYLSQFIIHDVTWMLPSGDGNRASAMLDFDSVIGNRNLRAPTSTDCPFHGPLMVGQTHEGSGVTESTFALPEDLPRKEFDVNLQITKPAPGYPLIPDTRNDDFLPLAQIHLSFLKFYNRVAKWCGYNGKYYNTEKALELFILHGQSVVLHDLLKRIVDPKIYEDVIHEYSGRRIVHAREITVDDPFYIPLEFAAGVARFGHSMIRDTYNWNHKHNSANIEHFMEFSHRNRAPTATGKKMLRIKRDWIVDWSTFFDLRDDNSPAGSSFFQNAKLIDTRLSSRLARLPTRIRERLANEPPPNPDQIFNLAQETLLRQREFTMRSAQFVIDKMNEILPESQKIIKLTEEELKYGAYPSQEINISDVISFTPIWFYVLREAEIQQSGQKLGQFGSRILMETLHAAIEASPISILKSENWKPVFPSESADCFTMTDLFRFVGNSAPLNSQKDY